MKSLFKHLYRSVRFPQRRKWTGDFKSGVRYHLAEGFVCGVGCCQKCGTIEFVAVHPDNIDHLHGCTSCWDSEVTMTVMPYSKEEWEEILNYDTL